MPRKVNENCYKTIELFQGNKNVNIPLHVQRICKHHEMGFVTNQTNQKEEQEEQSFAPCSMMQKLHVETTLLKRRTMKLNNLIQV
jgi:hypothetical protein